MLLDTSGLLCLHYQTEPLHTEARVAYKRATIRLTHSYIIAEYVALGTARRFPRSSVLAFVVDLLDNPDIKTVWVDEPLHRAAVDLLMERKDKTYSLCDALSFVLMRQRGITEALSTDRHFEQEGFIRLL
ncbi:type II toxin-antitoxin system VapC family toxin [Nostoc sp. WHI]|uniref:type II toxin-antitoxin system VapC family toxin n=1 Tax=Nostoc sp. WHI TaxID=2650611 RepID=UPI0018C54F48|nr:PIN domain-containing protein [Nostoc sp. WHI]MBG1265947.1 type II toxin-antitoxin system VapC family toxin [Nostoc sp. WHI]